MTIKVTISKIYFIEVVHLNLARVTLVSFPRTYISGKITSTILNVILVLLVPTKYINKRLASSFRSESKLTRNKNKSKLTSIFQLVNSFFYYLIF